MPKERKYTIAGTEYYQVPVTPWLSAMILEAVKGVDWNAPYLTLSIQLLRKAPILAAFVLIPAGMTKSEFYEQLDDQPGFIEERERFFKIEMSLMQLGAVVKDFLSENDIPSFLHMMMAMILEVTEAAEQVTHMLTPEESPSCAAATLPNDILLGALPPRN